MGKLLVITALALAVAIEAALAQEDVPSFEVVSVRINRSGSQSQDMRLLPGGRATVTNAPLRRVILTAYGMLPQQLIGGPAWLEVERFDIVAQARENLAASAPRRRARACAADAAASADGAIQPGRTHRDA